MKLLFIFGTRPEAIKMAPLLLKAKGDASLDVKVCVTGQHSEMLYQVLDFFGVRPDYDMSVMKHDQSIFHITAAILQGLEGVLEKERPDIVLVQGDTTTAFVGALAAFYRKTAAAHIEAGLRSHNNFSPFPEEMNRKLAGMIADLHFAPTERARENLLGEGRAEGSIHIVGNTVIDAMFITLDLIKGRGGGIMEEFNYLESGKRVILVTGHRRESFGEPFRDICLALKEIAQENDVEIVYPVHLNPNVRTPVFSLLSGQKNVHLIEPLTYPSLVGLMESSYLVLTDSGGIQEEAPSLGKPVLVMRAVTERVEGIEAGTCKLVGTDRGKIVREVTRLLADQAEYERMAKAVNPYGDGKASERILSILKGARIENTLFRVH